MPAAGKPEEVRYSAFLNEVHDGRVDSVVLQGDTIYGVRKDKSKVETYNPESNYTWLIGDLSKANVGIEGRPPPQPSCFTQLLRQMAPACLLLLVFVDM